MASEVLVLRTCDRNGRSHGGFQWPKAGLVECPDWNPDPVCGYGLHGLLWGEGDGSLLSWDESAVWLLVSVQSDTIVPLGGKVKFPKGHVTYYGSRQEALDYLCQNGGNRKLIVGGIEIVGDYGTAAAGYRGIAMACNHGTAVAGDYGKAVAGYRGTTIVSGCYGQASVGDDGTALVGKCGLALAGSGGIATAGNYGTASVGDGGTATAGCFGTAVAGDRGTAIADRGGTATAGNNGTLLLSFINEKDRKEIAIGYVGEAGILPNVPYRVGADGKLALAAAAETG